jgi:hypothetical protein
VLVDWPWDVVGSVDVSPVIGCGESGGINFLPGNGHRWLLSRFERGLLDSAAGAVLKERFSGGKWSCSVLVVLFVSGVFLLFLSGCVDLVVSPGVLGDGPCAIWFDGEVINTSDDSDESLLCVVGSPWVSDLPVFDSVLLSVTNDRDIVNDLLVSCLVFEDASFPGLKFVSDGDSAGNGSSLVDFLHHSLLSGDLPVGVNSVDVIDGCDEAGLVGLAVLADVDGGAVNTVSITSGLIDCAGLVSDLVLVHEVESTVCLSTIASHVVLGAWDHNLGGDVHIGPRSLSGDFDSVRKGRGGSLSPAWSAVLGNMLILKVGKVRDSVNVVPDELCWEGDFLKGWSEFGDDVLWCLDSARLISISKSWCDSNECED